MMRTKLSLRGWYKLRWKILQRDKFTCQYCGQYAPNVCLEVDHKIAFADKGTDDEDNLVTSCWSCNRGKNGLRQSMMQHSPYPRRPRPPYEQPRQNEILQVIKDSQEGLTSMEVMVMLKITRGSIDMAISRLKRKGLIIKSGTKWVIKDLTGVLLTQV